MIPVLFAIIIFALTYVLMIALPKYRYITALASAAVFVAVGTVPLSELAATINWNVLMMLFGTMGTVYFFVESKMPNRIAEKLLAITPNTVWAVAAMSLFAGFISAFLDNVATVLMIAPVGLAISKQLKISPVAMLIAISVSSNLQGAATLVGDTTSIMLGGYAGMDFLDFFWMDGKPGMFWAVELGAIATVPVILFLFRKDRGKVTVKATTEVNDCVPTILLAANIVLLIIASFIPNTPEMINGCICMGVFAAAAVCSAVRSRSFRDAGCALKGIDFETLLLLAGLFVVIEGVSRAGVIDAISRLFVSVGGERLFLLYTIIVWGSVLCSAFIDNIPYVATMLPVVSGIAAATGFSPNLLYFGLLTGATLGGNLTPIGASANIAAIGILRREGHEVGFKDFARIGVPFTLAAVIVGYLFIWLVWGM